MTTGAPLVPRCVRASVRYAAPGSASQGRGDDRLADDRQVVEAILEAEREADDEQRIADLDGCLRLRQVRRRECPIDRIAGQGRPVDFNDGHVDIAALSLQVCQMLKPFANSGMEKKTDLDKCSSPICSSISGGRGGGRSAGR
jgi:hypothetical protein